MVRALVCVHFIVVSSLFHPDFILISSWFFLVSGWFQTRLDERLSRRTFILTKVPLDEPGRGGARFLRSIASKGGQKTGGGSKVDSSTRQRVDASTRQRVDASTRRCVDTSMRRHVDALMPFRIDASTHRCVDASMRGCVDASTR